MDLPKFLLAVLFQPKSALINMATNKLPVQDTTDWYEHLLSPLSLRTHSIHWLIGRVRDRSM